MKTTVVIPVWDDYVEMGFERAVESVRSQDNGRVRIIVVDNASRRAVPAIDDVDVVELPSRVSLGEARNRGLAYVDTPFVMFWDADDLMLPGTLSVLERAAGTDGDTVAVIGSIVQGDGRLHHWPRRWTRRLAARPRLFAVTQAVWSCFPTTGAALLRTSCVRACGGFPHLSAGDDWALGVSLAFRGRVQFIEHPGRLYRHHPASVSAEWRTFPHIAENARTARHRLSRDPEVPLALRRAVPLIAALQTAIMVTVRPVARAFRRYRAAAPKRDAIEPEDLCAT